MNYLKCDISFEYFPVTCYLQFNSIVANKLTLYNFNFYKFVEIYFMAQDYLSWYMFSDHVEHNVFRYSYWVECSINVD